jgi:hypothetical protein
MGQLNRPIGEGVPGEGPPAAHPPAAAQPAEPGGRPKRAPLEAPQMGQLNRPLAAAEEGTGPQDPSGLPGRPG